MKKYRSGHDYLFLADNPFMYKGDYIGATSVNVLFKVFDAEGNEKLFESEELEEQELFSKDGKPYYLCDFINCYIDKEHVLNFEPNMTVFREIGCPYTLQWEKSYYTKDILIGHTLHPKNISEDEFLEIMKNNMELFDIRDNLPAQTTTFFTQEIIMLHDYKEKNVPTNFRKNEESL